MIDRMNQREKIMFAAVAALLVVLLNIFLLKAFIARSAEFRDQLTAAQTKLGLLRKRESERDLWAKRDAWLTQKLPKLGDTDEANKALREAVLGVAKRHSVILEAPAPGVPVPQPNRVSLSIRLDAKGKWQDIFLFLLELQGPEKFIAIENCELKVNRDDKTQFRAALTVAQWFAPR